MTRAVSLSHTRPRPPCGSLIFYYLLCKPTYPYPVTLLPIGLGYFRAIPSLVRIPKLFSTLVIIHLLAYEDRTQCSETSAYKIQTPGNYPEDIQHTEHGESFKSRILAIPLDINVYRVRQKALCTCGRLVLRSAGRRTFPHIKHFRWRKWPLSHAHLGHFRHLLWLTTVYLGWRTLWAISYVTSATCPWESLKHVLSLWRLLQHMSHFQQVQKKSSFILYEGNLTDSRPTSV
jgi:hypothetical protein